jgi:hypothetical protein
MLVAIGPEKGWGNGLFVLSEKTLEKESEATGRAEAAKPLLPAEGDDRSASLLDNSDGVSKQQAFRSRTNKR